MSIFITINIMLQTTLEKHCEIEILQLRMLEYDVTDEIPFRMQQVKL
jgi:hypothetical protein